MTRRPGRRAGVLCPQLDPGRRVGAGYAGAGVVVCCCGSQCCWFCGLLRARAVRCYGFACVRLLSSSTWRCFVTKDSSRVESSTGEALASGARAADGLERRMLEDALNRCVAAVHVAEVELRKARADERRARTAVGLLAHPPVPQDRR